MIKAEPWCIVDSSDDVMLDGPAFDRNGDLFVTVPSHSRILKIGDDRRSATVFENNGVAMSGSAFHRDGRLFVGCPSGGLLVVDPDGASAYLHPTYRGDPLLIHDLVFDRLGHVFLTDSRGSALDPAGRICRASSDGTQVELVLGGLASPKGLSLSPEGDALWVADTARNTVVHVSVVDDGLTPAFADRVVVAYRSVGLAGPCSNTVDADGNLYQCIMGQGRLVVLDPIGIPVANVVVAGREEGIHLRTTSLAFRPGTDEAYVTTSGVGGAWVYMFKGLAKGQRLFSHS